MSAATTTLIVPARRPSHASFALRRVSILVIELVLIGLVLELIQSIPLFDPSIFPKPSTVLRTGYGLAASGELFVATGWSLIRVAIGYGLAVLVGVPLGILIGRYKLAEWSVGTVINLLRPIPTMAWIPLAILWFGVGLKGSCFLIFYGSLFPIVVNCAAGVRTVDKVYLELVRTLGASPAETFREVILPGAVPSIVTGLRLGLGIAWIVVVTAELFGARTGLGYMITAGQNTYRVDAVFVGMAMIGVIGFAIDLGFRRLQAHLLRWRENAD
jgi:ABC-type nitrate/sulfonate/bicarbonate transport system permease component